MEGAKVKDVMVSKPKIISPDTTLQEACSKMKELDCGILPVGTSDKIEGMITDRDIAIRAIAEGVDSAFAKVEDYMTRNVRVCKAEDSLKDAAKAMNRHNVSRLLVRSEDNEVVGILTFGHMLRSGVDNDTVVDVVCSAVGRKAA